MKKVLGCVLLIFVSLQCIYAQCNTQQFAEKGIKKLSEAGGYTFLKTYPVEGQTGKQYSYIFSNGTKYLITLANNQIDAKGVYIKILDANKQEVVSSMIGNKSYPAISFIPHKTGIYYLLFAFDNTRNYCAAGVLGMKR
jgi:hypothetical protein